MKKEELKKLRKQAFGSTPKKDVAKFAGVRTETIWRWESGMIPESSTVFATYVEFLKERIANE